MSVDLSLKHLLDLQWIVVTVVVYDVEVLRLLTIRLVYISDGLEFENIFIMSKGVIKIILDKNVIHQSLNNPYIKLIIKVQKLLF